MYPNLLYVGRNFSQKFEEQGWWDCQCVWSCCWWREQDLHYYSSCFNPGCCCCSCLYNSSNEVGKQGSDNILFTSFLLLRYCLIFTGFSNQALYQLLSTGQVQFHSCDENTQHGQNIDRLELSFLPMTNTQEFKHCYKIILIFQLQWLFILITQIMDLSQS